MKISLLIFAFLYFVYILKVIYQFKITVCKFIMDCLW